MAEAMNEQALPGAPMMHRVLGVVAVLVVGAVAAYVGAQMRAAPETALALAFLTDIQQQAPTAAERAEGDALAVLGGARGESTPGFGAVRDSLSFQAVSTTVEWGGRCVEVDAYGTVRHKLYVEVMEGTAGFRVTRVLTAPPYSGPCSGD